MRLKRAKNDFTVNDLPKNRYEVFADCLKERFLLFLSIGLTLLLFSLPLFFVTLLSDNTSAQLYSAYRNGESTQEQLNALMDSATSLYSLFNIPCYIVLAIGAAGVMQIIRQLVWGEGVFFMQDFAEGVRSNGVNYAFIAFILGLAAYLENTFFPFSSGGISVAVPIIFLLVVIPPMMFMISQIAVYKNPFLKYLVNGFTLYIKTVPTTFLFLLLFLLPAVLGLNLIPLLVKYIILLIFFLLLAPMLLTGWFLYSCFVFDKLINKEAYPEIYDKGVYRNDKPTNE